MNVSVLVSPAGIEAGEKALLIVGGFGFICIDALAVLPVPFAEVTAPLVLLYKPLDCAVTFTETVHVPLAEIVPPLNASEVAPIAGVKVGDPQPVRLIPVGLATTICPGKVGKVSLNETFV